MKENGSRSESTMLRRNAEKLLKKKTAKKESCFSEEDTLKLIHELEVHQIELEIQNEELVRTRIVAQDLAKRYSELYDFAPSGYFTLSKEKEIIELNICGAQMLGKDRDHLKNSRFGFFVSDETKPMFNHFLKKVFNGKGKESCEVILLTTDNKSMCVHLDGIIIGNGKQCLLTAIDVTIDKLVDALKKKTEELKQFNDILVSREIKMIELKKEINQLLKNAGGEAKYVIHK